jgi:hypothetical protein
LHEDRDKLAATHTATIAAAFEAERKAVLAALEAKSEHGSRAAAVHAVKSARGKWRDAVATVHEDAAKQGAASLVGAASAAGVPGADSYTPDAPDDELGQWSDTVADGISATNADRIGSIIDGLAKDAAIAVVLAAIGSAYDTWTGSQDDGDPSACRASDIAGDAATAGWHYGEMDAALGLSASVATLEATRTWTSLGDARTRATHQEADGQEAGTTDTFTVGADQLRFPCDPDGSPEEVCNCRCYLYWSFTWDGAATNPGRVYDNNDAETLGYE